MNGATLIGRLLPRTEITAEQRDQMFALMERYYAGMRRECFEADLREKQWVIQVLDADTSAIRGFSTQRLLEAEQDGRTIFALFSGDTIVDRECWTGNPLAQVWGRFALALIDAFPNDPLFWFLIAKGFRTYRFLPVFFREFYPRYDAPTPTWAKATIDLLAGARFPGAYHPAAGIVRPDAAPCRLREGVGDVTPTRALDPHVRFFVKQNPGHVRGDELCCLAPLTRENFTRAAYRAIGEMSTGPQIDLGSIHEFRALDQHPLDARVPARSDGF